MKKTINSSDIETKIIIQEKIANISKRIDKKRETYELIKKHLKNGFDITTGREITDKAEIERRIREERDKFYNYKQRKISQIIDIEHEIDEKNFDVDDKIIISSGSNSDRKIKKRILRNVKTIIAAEILAAALVISSISCSIYRCHEDEVNRKTEEYADHLHNVIDNATYSRIGNLVYQHGNVVETLDKDKTADSEYTYIDYGDIANYIKKSDNPDLAAFALFKYYGRSNNPKHHRIVAQTFKTLEFDGSTMGSIDNFQEYLNSNGYESYADYYKDTRKELFSDGDSNLDNIKVKIKKMTK